MNVICTSLGSARKRKKDKQPSAGDWLGDCRCLPGTQLPAALPGLDSAESLTFGNTSIQFSVSPLPRSSVISIIDSAEKKCIFMILKIAGSVTGLRGLAAGTVVPAQVGYAGPDVAVVAVRPAPYYAPRPYYGPPAYRGYGYGRGYGYRHW